MLRISTQQLTLLEQGLFANVVDRVDTYLRKHYPEECGQYGREVLRVWITRNLDEMKVRGVLSTDEVLLDMGTRWVLRAWYGEPLVAESSRPYRSP
jgi:hypothetical protein